MSIAPSRITKQNPTTPTKAPALSGPREIEECVWGAAAGAIKTSSSKVHYLSSKGGFLLSHLFVVHGPPSKSGDSPGNVSPKTKPVPRVPSSPALSKMANEKSPQFVRTPNKRWVLIIIFVCFLLDFISSVFTIL